MIYQFPSLLIPLISCGYCNLSLSRVLFFFSVFSEYFSSFQSFQSFQMIVYPNCVMHVSLNKQVKPNKMQKWNNGIVKQTLFIYREFALFYQGLEYARSDWRGNYTLSLEKRCLPAGRSREWCWWNTLFQSKGNANNQ